MAEYLGSHGKYADSEKFFNQALTLDPAFPEAVQGLVTVLMQEKKPEVALAKVNEAIAKAPNASGFYILQAQLLLSQKQFDQAEAALQKAADLNKSDATPLVMLAQVQMSRGTIDAAIANSQKAIRDNPNDARSYFLLGYLEQNKGDWQQAESLYQKCLQIQPDVPQASNNLAFLMLDHGGNVDVALSLAQTARQKLPDQPAVADTLAWAYYKKGAYQAAIDLLEEAIKKAPQDADIQYHLGLAYKSVNEVPAQNRILSASFN